MNFIVHKPTFPLLDAVLICVNDALMFKERAVMKWRKTKKKHTLVAVMRNTFNVGRKFVMR